MSIILIKTYHLVCDQKDRVAFFNMIDTYGVKTFKFIPDFIKEDRKSLMKLIDTLESLDDVVSVHSNADITEEILETPLVYENFELQIPKGPGLGITLDEDRIQFFNRAQRH